MKRIGLILVISLISLKVSAQTAVTDTLKFSADKKQISTFLNLMHIAGLDSIYSGKPVTIFAPDNEAFEKLPGGIIDSLLKPTNKQQLIALLSAHIVPQKLTAKEIGQLIRQKDRETILVTLTGSILIAKINANRNIVISDKYGSEAIVSQFDIQHFNAAFFIITSVLLPKK